MRMIARFWIWFFFEQVEVRHLGMTRAISRRAARGCLLRRHADDRTVLDLVLLRAGGGPASGTCSVDRSGAALHQSSEQPDRFAARGRDRPAQGALPGHRRALS